MVALELSQQTLRIVSEPFDHLLACKLVSLFDLKLSNGMMQVLVIYFKEEKTLVEMGFIILIRSEDEAVARGNKFKNYLVQEKNNEAENYRFGDGKNLNHVWWFFGQN